MGSPLRGLLPPTYLIKSPTFIDNLKGIFREPVNIPTKSGEGDCVAVQFVVKNDAHSPLDSVLERLRNVVEDLSDGRLPRTQN